MKTISIRVFTEQEFYYKGFRGIGIGSTSARHSTGKLLFGFVKENGSNQGSFGKKLSGTANVIQLSGNCKAIVDLPILSLSMT
jgi:hypothetical protein